MTGKNRWQPADWNGIINSVKELWHLVYIRNGLMPHLWGINLSHIYAREVRWNFEFNSWYSSKICSCLSKKTRHSLHLHFFEMSTLKGDVRVKLFYLRRSVIYLTPGGVSFPMSSPFFFIYLCLHENFLILWHITFIHE